MTMPRHFDSYTTARQQFRAVLDSAASGAVTTLDRDDQRFVVMPAEHLRQALATLRPAAALVVPEGGGWAVILPGVPVHGDGATFMEAIDDAIDALREYATDWNDRLRVAPNHQQHRSLVELVELSTDDELREWLLGDDVSASAEADRPAEDFQPA